MNTSSQNLTLEPYNSTANISVSEQLLAYGYNAVLHVSAPLVESGSNTFPESSTEYANDNDTNGALPCSLPEWRRDRMRPFPLGLSLRRGKVQKVIIEHVDVGEGVVGSERHMDGRSGESVVSTARDIAAMLSELCDVRLNVDRDFSDWANSQSPDSCTNRCLFSTCLW